MPCNTKTGSSPAATLNIFGERWNSDSGLQENFMKCGLNDGVLYDVVIVGIDPTVRQRTMRNTSGRGYFQDFPRESDYLRRIANLVK